MNIPNRMETAEHSLLGRFFTTMRSIPSEAYYAATVGSILAAALLFLSGRRHTALFVGEWAPTFLASALFYKMLRPTGQRMGERMGESVSELTR